MGLDALKALAGEMNSGAVSTLVVLGGNPVYNAPADLQLACGVRQGRAARFIWDGDEDETGAAAKLAHSRRALP